ncbi:MAG: UvrD-helicase domain-containing protein [Clostridia bacterium]|nr:UvrD-helicase domain-containing protein [Clostridia bacterium]
MSISFSNSQKRAIESNCPALVSAAAGSGKTAVLVERVIRKIAPEDKNIPAVPANRLLIVTFTNLAAAEMRTRIEKAIYEKIRQNPDDENLRIQKHLLQNADICTIDSFCAKLVRENFSYFSVSPDFSLSEGLDLADKANAALDEILKPYFEENSDAFNTALSLTGCEYDELKFKHIITEELFYKAMNKPFYESYLDNLAKPYATIFDKNSVWYQKTFEIAKETIKLCLNEAEKLRKTAEFVGVNSEYYIEYGEVLISVLQNLYDNLNSDYDTFRSVLSESNAANIKRAAKKDEYTERIKGIKHTIDKKIKGLQDIFHFTTAETEELRKRLQPAVELIIEIEKRFINAFFEICKEENSITFSFLEQMVFSFLCKNENGKIFGTAEADSIISKYDEVMVDEYQDVNDLQDAIFNILSSNGEKLFVVGDVKQSIYGFRGSNPENFIEKDEKAKKDPLYSRVFLSENYRSSYDVCATANFLFSNLITGEVGKLVYSDEEKLSPKAVFPFENGSSSELLVVDNSDKYNKRLDTEALAIADYIKRTMAAGDIIKVDDNTLRPAKYSDFAILLRSLKDKVEPIADILSKEGIPVSFDKESFIETYEIKLILSLLKVINNPKSDIELLHIMLSPLFDFTAEELAIIRLTSKKGSLYGAVILACENGDKKCKSFVQKLEDYRRIFITNTLGEAIARIYSVTGITDYVAIMPGGDVKRTNLLLLSKIANEYSSRFAGGIYGFLKYLESLPDKAFNTSQNTGGGVKIMTMHKSKGLQFPICILANLAYSPNTESKTTALYDEKLGIAFRYYDEQLCEKTGTTNFNLAAYKEKMKSVEEDLRLLYVAATRAEDRVCYICSGDNLQKRFTNLYNRLSDKYPFITKEALLQSKSMFDYVISCALLSDNFYTDIKGFDVEPPFEKSGFNIPVYTYTPVENKKETNSDEKEDNTAVNEEIVSALIYNYSYNYPYSALSKIESKVSVSRLANGEEAERFAFTAKPSFMNKDGLSSAEAGSAMHHVMQFISFDKADDVEGEIERLKEWRFISEDEAKSLNIKAIKDFFRSDLFAKIKESKDVRREMRFLTEVPVIEVENDAKNIPLDTSILVQGAVDLCFTDGNEVTVLDFKTDRVDNLEVLKDRYSEQLLIYSKACEKVFKKKVTKRIIYSFNLSDYIVF